MTATIQPRRGPEATIPVLADGELAITTDTHRAFVGTGSGNVDVTAAYTLLGDTTPTPLSESGSGVAGTSALAARADHRHPLIVNADVSATAGIVLSKIGQSAASLNDVPFWNGSAWTPGPSGSYTLPDATTGTIGGVEVDHAASGAHSVALTTDGIALPSGMLSASTPLSESGSGATGTALLAARSDHRHPLIADADVSGSAAIAKSKLASLAIVDADVSALSLAILTGIGASNGNVPVWNGTHWVAGVVSGSGLSTTLAGDTDVGITSPANGDLLQFNSGTGKWENVTKPFDVLVSLAGQPTASQTLADLLIPGNVTSVTFPANFSGSAGAVGTNPTATATYTLTKNGSAAGTIAISTGGGFTFTTTGGTTLSLAPGDEFILLAPSVVDTTLANVRFTLVGTRI